MDFPTREAVDELLPERTLPPMADVRYRPPSEALEDVAGAATAAVGDLPLRTLSAGDHVAVGVGSRGIASLPAIVSAIVEELQERDLNPTIVPAMGSHGGATAAGQREVLGALGITEPAMGCPIDARMDTERVGVVTVNGVEIPVHVSTAAREADGCVVVNRVKPHTNYTGDIESGLCKMSVVGLGKQRGANAFHETALSVGYVETLRTAFSAVRTALPLLGGVAVVEDFYEEIAVVEGIPAAALPDAEKPLLERARSLMATLPTDRIDLLVIDEIGKDISGSGMDTNVVGRYRVLNTEDPTLPDVKLIYVRGLSRATKHNGMGIGLADLTRRSVVDDIDITKTYTNALTSGSLAKVHLPLVLPDDESAIAAALGALGTVDDETARVVWIENTSELSRLRLSPALVDELADRIEVESVVNPTFVNGEVQFDRRAE
ncbi:DUF362 domain-containing protein [Halomarina ordinaria]|uniref:DUF362 domain-containing protein n=1 Tax=Halomarina ordinaria TaxID=3033939 RepID=A0ABD5UBZ5_9EURY